METMNVTFDELSTMAFEQRSSKPRLQSMTSGQISSGLDLTYASSIIKSQKLTERELDLLFEAMYDDYIGGQPSAVPRTAPASSAPQVLQTSTTSTTIKDTAPTPTNSSSQPIKDKLDPDKNGTLVDATKYRRMIGALMYLTSSRPDIVHATCLCARYQAKPTEKHLKVVKRLTDYGFHFYKIPIYCDSKSAIAISCNLVQHSRAKYIVIRYHFIKEHVEKCTIELYFVKTDYQLADLFSKALPVDRFNYMARRLGIRSLFPQELERLAKSH
ncbi:hypothetical protein Tco_0087231 [Tanacetum coccineum]